ncbi:MAG: hypothetical protein WKF84_20725 [Pyrinomonadaceae bacterium]
MGNDDVAFHLKLAFNYNVWFQRKEAVVYYRHSHSAGARLNREHSALMRYLDAHQSWVIHYAAEHETRTGDSRPRFWAERALINSIAELAHHQTKKSGALRRRLLRRNVQRTAQQGLFGRSDLPRFT